MDRISEERPYVIAEVTFLPPQKGGRKSMPFAGYMPHVVVECEDDFLGVRFADNPSEHFGVPAKVRLILMYYPHVNYSKLKKDIAFSIKEGGRTVGSGRVIATSEEG